MMRFGYHASKDGDSEESKRTFTVEVSATEWSFERRREDEVRATAGQPAERMVMAQYRVL